MYNKIIKEINMEEQNQQPIEDTKFSKLRRFNIIMAVMHAIQGFLMLFLSFYY